MAKAQHDWYKAKSCTYAVEIYFSILNHLDINNTIIGYWTTNNTHTINLLAYGAPLVKALAHDGKLGGTVHNIPLH